MANLAITAANVVKGDNARVKTKYAAAAITAGQAVYVDATDKLNIADGDNASATVRKVAGIALNSAAIGQPVAYVSEGDVTLGAVLTAGAIYVLSTTAGAIAPVADLAAGNYTTVIGVAKSTTVLAVAISTAGVAVA